MDDVVEQGRRDGSGPPAWLRGGALAVALALGVLVVTRSHVLSADAPTTPHPRASQGPPRVGQNVSQGISIVVRRGELLERYEAGSGSRPLAELPPGLPDPTLLLQAPQLDGTGPLVGVDHGVLFRISPSTGRMVTPIGRADRVLAQSPEPGRLFVVEPVGSQQARVVEIDANSGQITNSAPFPGYPASTPWRPVAIVSSPGGGSALLLTRPAPKGQLEMALAWDGFSIHAAQAPTFARIGITREVLGVAQTRILTLDNRGSGAQGSQPITVRSVTRDRVLTRTVAPPPGWAFGDTVVGGGGGDPIAVVSRLGDQSELGLARLVIGASHGLMVAGSAGMSGSVLPVAGPEGSVVFAVPGLEGDRLNVWLAGSRSSALLIDLPPLKSGSQLVCACR
jgi:hypothetical protein